MLTCVGRGGDGQKVRDEILNIMHRNHIKELKGTWMEEWHQKLHNNTTPDDVGICAAYIAFLESEGDRGVYWNTLSEYGITRERLESFDRAIRTEPEYFADKRRVLRSWFEWMGLFLLVGCSSLHARLPKDPVPAAVGCIPWASASHRVSDCRDDLIKEFYAYLTILKSVHTGADLSTSLANCQRLLKDQTKGLVGFVLAHMNDPQVLPLIEAAVEARAQLDDITGTDLEVMYLDLALEQVVRSAAERGVGASGNATALLAPLLQNLCLSYHDNEELCYCLKAWTALPGGVLSGRPSKQEAMQAMAVVDRSVRCLSLLLVNRRSSFPRHWPFLSNRGGGKEGRGLGRGVRSQYPFTNLVEIPVVRRIRRALAAISDQTSHRIAPWADKLGRAFGCDQWAVELFSEEVIRGGPAFSISLLLSAIDPLFRRSSDMAPWQVISPHNATGWVEVVDSLHKVQDKTYAQPTVLICKR